jgi:hypothetical protein
MAREICEILVAKDEGPDQAVCRFVLDNGKLTGEPIAPDGAKTMRGILATTMFIKNGAEEVSSKDQPRAWFLALPSNITGSYVRAKMVT